MERVLLLSVITGVCLVLLMPLIVSERSFFPFIVGKALYSRAIIEVTFGLWLVLAYSHPAYRVPRSWLLVAFAVYLGVALLAGLLGVSSQRSLWSTYERMQGVVDLAHWLALTVVVTSVFRSLADWRFLLNLNLGVSLVMALIGVGQQYDRNIVPFYDFIEKSSRLDITLGNSTFVGAYMLVNVLIGLGFLAQSYQAARRPVQSQTRGRRRRRRREMRVEAADPWLMWWRLFWIAVVALDFWVLTLSGTRGAFIGLGAGLIAFAAGYMVWGQVRALRLAVAGLIGVLALVALLFAVARDTELVDRIADSNILVRRISSIGLDDASVQGRLAALEVGLEGFAARPILGWGPENFLVAFGRYFEIDPDVPETFDQAHNKLVEELTTKGIIGFLSYSSLWALMLWTVVRRVRRRDTQQLFMLFMGAAMTGYFVQNLFLFDTPGTVLQFILLLAFVINLETTFEESPAQATDAEAEGGRTNPARATGVQRPWDVRLWVGLIGVLTLVSLGVYSLNIRTYQAATAVVKTANPAITWDQRFELFEESIDSFPPLANYPRQVLFAQLTNNWDLLSPDEIAVALVTMEREAEDAIKAEPRGWRIYVALAQLYQKASPLGPEYDQKARSFVDKAIELAPNTPQIAALKQQFGLPE